MMHRRAFAMTFAIILTGLVALTLASLGSACFLEARRTAALAADAQLRQLLLAGEIEAQSRLAARSLSGQTSISIPGDLADEATLILRPHPGETIIQIDATLQRRHMSQLLTFAQTDGEWRLVSAQLLY